MHVLSRSSAKRCSRLEPTLGHLSCNMEQIYNFIRRAGQDLPGVRNSNSSKAVQTVAAATTNRRRPQAQRDTVRLAVVGDVHGQWGPADAAAVRALEADAVLWVGDIGNEDVGMVQQIASLDDLEKAVILGNHDAWYTMTARGRQRASHKHGSSPPRGSSLSSAQQQQQHQEQQQEQEQQVFTDRVQQQLDALDSDHVGYGYKALPGAKISIVGARPFSKGGKDFSSMADFLARFGVSSMQQSADKILEVINTQVPRGNALIIMAHNGPTGMGGERHSICGCDWLAEAGDHGDPDLQQVLLELQQAGRQVALLLHGHMHHMIKGGGRRQMVHIDPAFGTVVLNAATVPRVVALPHSNGSAAASRHHFLVVELQAGVPTCAADVWVQTAQQSDNTSTSTSTSSSSSSDPAILEKQKSFLASSASAMHGIQHNKSKTKTAKQAAAKAAQDEAVRRVQLQAPQQVDLSAQQDPHVIDGYQVHVAEVYEVLRTVQPAGGTDGSTADAMAGAQAGGDGSGSSGVGSLGVRSWQYFDAHQGKWVSVVVDGVAAGVAAGVAVPAAAPIGSIC